MERICPQLHPSQLLLARSAGSLFRLLVVGSEILGCVMHMYSCMSKRNLSILPVIRKREPISRSVNECTHELTNK